MRIVVLFIFIITLQTGALACNSPSDVCEHIKYCAVLKLTDNNKVDRDRLNAAIERQDENEIYAATEACQRNVGDIKKWERDSGGCGGGLNQIAQGAKSAGWQCPKRTKAFCYTQGKYYAIDGLQCRTTGDTYCTCNIYGQTSPGQIHNSTY